MTAPTITPVDQTCTEPGRGDSLPACLATIVGCRLGDVPDLDQGRDTEALFNWLARHEMAGAVMLGDLDLFLLRRWVNRYCVVLGPSPRNPRETHAVVGRLVDGGIEIVHDPHPSRAGIGEPWSGVIALFSMREWVSRLYPEKT